MFNIGKIESNITLWEQQSFLNRQKINHASVINCFQLWWAQDDQTEKGKLNKFKRRSKTTTLI